MRLFDLHCDTLAVCLDHGSDLFSNSHHVDIERASRMLDSWVQVLAIFVPDGSDDRAALYRVDRALSFYDRQKLTVSPDSRVRFLLSLENGAGIGTDLSCLHTLSQRGVTSVALTWNGSNRLGNGCMSRDTTGLSAFGKQVVQRMYREHIVPDVSHLNERGFWDVAYIADERPFIASHSVSKAVCNHPRNLSDDQFRAIVRVKGRVGLNLCTDQLGGTGELIDRFRRHLDHFLELDGAYTVALGLDLDGTDLDETYQGIQVVSYLYEELLKLNYSETLLDRLFFQNSYDFFEKTLTSRSECIKIGT